MLLQTQCVCVILICWSPFSWGCCLEVMTFLSSWRWDLCYKITALLKSRETRVFHVHHFLFLSLSLLTPHFLWGNASSQAAVYCLQAISEPLPLIPLACFYVVTCFLISIGSHISQLAPNSVYKWGYPVLTSLLPAGYTGVLCHADSGGAGVWSQGFPNTGKVFCQLSYIFSFSQHLSVEPPIL